MIHIRQIRKFLIGDTASALSIDASTWLSLLRKYYVFPSFIELMHNNNGGTLVHTSREPPSILGESQDQRNPLKTTPEAFHVAYKMGNAMDEETAVCARYNFKTGRTFVLVLGTDNVCGQARALRLLEAEPRASLFHIVFAFQSTALAALEQKRWQLDYATLEFETDTGLTTMGQPGAVNAQLLQKLEWNRDRSITATLPRFMMWASSQLTFNFKALLRHISIYDEFSRDCPRAQIDSAKLESLRNACQMKAELAQSQHDQTRGLQGRLDNQLGVVRTLRVHRDTDLNIEIAEATRRDSEINIRIAEAVKRDSELMRRITLITMFFLPATFVASFFSMVFFQVGNQPAVRSFNQIWWYAAVTIPLTFVISLSYLLGSEKPLLRALGDFFRSTRNGSVDSQTTSW